MGMGEGISKFRKARRTTVLFIQVLFFLLVSIALYVYWEKFPGIYTDFRVQNLISVILELDNTVLYGTILTLSIGYVGYLLHQTSLNPEAIHQESKREGIVNAVARSIYTGTAPLLLFYSAVIFNASPIIAVLVGILSMGVSGLSKTKFGSYAYYLVLVLFSALFLMIWLFDINEATPSIELVFLLSVILLVASIEEAGKSLNYVLDYDMAIEYINEREDKTTTQSMLPRLVTQMLSPRVAIMNIIIALVFMYHLNFHLISFSYLILSVPIVTRSIKLLSFNPKQYYRDIELEDKTLEGVFIYSEPVRGDYIAVLSEEGKKRISKSSIVSMSSAEIS